MEEDVNRPIPEYIDEPLPVKWAQYMGQFGLLMGQISVRNIQTFPVTSDSGVIRVEIE